MSDQNNMGKGKETAPPPARGKITDRVAAQLAQRKAANDAAAERAAKAMAEYEAARAARPPVVLLPGEDVSKYCLACPPKETRPRQLDDW